MISASMPLAIQFYHLDPMDIVWHGNYLRFFEQARGRLLDKIGYNYPQMKASGYAWPIIDVHVRYVRPLTYQQKVTITATLMEYENRLKIRYLITDSETGQKLTKGETVQVAVDIASNEMSFVSPQEFQDKVKAASCV
jgi:acyl-CoA thioester hydrolase